MRRRLADIVLRLAVLVGLGVSSALLWDYFRPLPAFCDVGSGCDRVRASGYGALLGIPVPLIGILGFATLLAAALGASPRAQRWARLLALAAGGAGLALLLVQGAVLGVFCRLCVAVDIAAIVAAGAALVSHRGTSDAPTASSGADTGAERRLWLAAAVAAVALPGVWSLVQPSPPVPPEIARLWRPNAINVIEFADFECPFCRELHPAMAELLHEYEGRLNFVRLNMPLDSHVHARDAARAYVCADQAGRGEAMADALFASDDLSPEGCTAMASALGIDPAAFRVCVSSASTDARIADEIRQVRAAGLAGLPTVWIGEQMFIGARSKDVLRDAFEQASRGSHRRWPLAWLWAALAVVLGVVGWRAWKAQEGTRP